MSEWRTIESAPRDGRHFFATGWHEPRGPIATGHWWVGLARYERGAGPGPPTLVFENRRIDTGEITHWMPLPSPPSEAASPLGGPTLALEEQESVSSNASLPRTLPSAHTNPEPAAEGEP